jgi:hypothetical protein
LPMLTERLLKRKLSECKQRHKPQLQLLRQRPLLEILLLKLPRRLPEPKLLQRPQVLEMHNTRLRWPLKMPLKKLNSMLPAPNIKLS